MDWLEITLEAHGDPDALCDTLTALGVESFQIEDEHDFQNFLENNTQYWDFVDDALTQKLHGTSRVKFWISNDSDGHAVLERIKAHGFTPDVKLVRDSDWENNWKEFYKPIEIGERLIIVPEWEEYTGERKTVRLDPGLLFGTGDHPTTKMCLSAVEQFTVPKARVLDIGCGSGILGIAAAVLGASEITAADVDEKAPKIVRENAMLNHVEDRFLVHVGDVIADSRLRSKLGSGYNLVLANIVADVIIPLAPYVPSFLAPESIFVCSGIIDGREDETALALKNAGLSILRHDRMEEWNCFICRRTAR